MAPTQSYHHPPVFQQSTRHVARMSYSPNQGQQLKYSVSQQVTQQPQQQFAAPPPATNNNWGNFTESVSADITSSSSSSVEDINWDVRLDQIASSTSEAMWMLAPPSSSVLEEEFAISSITEEFGLGDQELPMEFLMDKFRNKLEVLPDSNILNSTLNEPTTTQKGKRKRNSTWDFNGGEYVEPAEESQDYSKSDGLVYSKEQDPPVKRLKLDNEPLDEEKLKEGRFYVHASPAANLFDQTLTNLEPHSFDLDGGIMAQGLKPMVQTSKKSKKPIRGVWAVPGGRAPWTIAHIVRTHGEALKKSGGKVALIMIFADDDRIKNFIRFQPGTKWSESCHPAYSREEIHVYPKDVFIVDIKKLPFFLKQIKEYVLALFHSELMHRRKQVGIYGITMAGARRNKLNDITNGITMAGARRKKLNCITNGITMAGARSIMLLGMLQIEIVHNNDVALIPL